MRELPHKLLLLAQPKPFFKPLALGVFGTLVIVVAFLPVPADAWFHDDFARAAGAGLLSIFLGGALWIINWISIAVVFLAATVMQITMSFVLSASYTPITAAETSGVAVGWEIIRDITNGLFIIILIAIAIGTMLNLKVRGAALNARLLVWFVVIALLINFSPFLTALVIDISNILTKIFFDEAAGGTALFSNESVNPFMSSSDFALEQNLKEVAGQSVRLLVSIIFNLVTALILLLISALMVVRVLALQLLVIFSPLAFAAYILPATREYFFKWSHQFFQWALLPIPVGLFLFLGIVFAGNSGLCTSPLPPAPTGVGTGSQGEHNDITNDIVGNNQFCQVTLMGMGLGTMVAGMFVAFSISAMGSGLIVKQGQRIQQGTTKWANRRFVREPASAVKRKAGRATSGVAERAGNRLVDNPVMRNRWNTRRLLNAATLGAGSSIMQGAGRGMQGYANQQRASWRQFQPGYEKLTDDQLVRNVRAERNGDRLTAAMDVLSQRNPRKADEARREGTINKDVVERYLNASKGRPGSGDNWLAANPHDRAVLGEDENRIIERVAEMDSAALDKLSTTARGDINVAKGILGNDNLSESKLRRMTQRKEDLLALDTSMQQAIDNLYKTNDKPSRLQALKNTKIERLEKMAAAIENDPHLNARMPNGSFLGNGSAGTGGGPGTGSAARAAAGAAAAGAAAAGAAAGAGGRPGPGTPPPSGGTPPGGGGGTPPPSGGGSTPPPGPARPPRGPAAPPGGPTPPPARGPATPPPSPAAQRLQGSRNRSQNAPEAPASGSPTPPPAPSGGSRAAAATDA
ncbi:MAG: hypothetical protein WD850_00550, partial [Candidatus Spechtbacterales bacterium]